jgi:hypothetical protein
MLQRKTALRWTLLTLAAACMIPTPAEAQGRGNGRGHDGPEPEARVGAAVVVSGPEFGLSVELRTHIRDFYAARPPSNVEALPPGIRRNLARGKPLPPGIAKKMVPPDLASRVHVREGYALVEVGLDVFLVEVATNVVHDILMDVIR